MEYIECPECGMNEIPEGVKMCEACEIERRSNARIFALEEQVQQWSDAHAEAAHERDSMRAERDSMRAERDRLRLDIGRLLVAYGSRDEFDGIEEAMADAKAIREERDRLREALAKAKSAAKRIHEIAVLPLEAQPLDDAACACELFIQMDDIREIAEAALALCDRAAKESK